VSKRIAWYWRWARAVIDWLDDHVPDPTADEIAARLEAKLVTLRASLERLTHPPSRRGRALRAVPTPRLSS
jgi:hypothetical protein